MFRPKIAVVSPTLVLLILLTILPNPSFVRANPNTIHVPQDYPTIQQAVNAASPGDTIIVSAGIYSGNITIGKSLALIGASAASVIVNASKTGPGIIINATSSVSISQLTIADPDSINNAVRIVSSLNVVLSGNTIRSSVPGNGSNGTWIYNSNGVVLRNNTITGNLYGVAVQGGFSNTIQANNLTGNKAANILVANATGLEIKNNFIRRSQSGVDIRYGSSRNLVESNTIANNTLAGISISDSDNNRIIGNSIDFNNATSTKGVNLQNTLGNRFFNNNIRHNSVQIFGVFSSDMTSNTWNDGAASPRGNFWSDYNGIDNDTSGIGDTNVPWPCPNGGRPCSSTGNPAGVDYYPLMAAVKPPVLMVSASAQPLTGCAAPAPLLVNFTGVVQGGASPYTYSWRFGDGLAAGNVSSVSHYYTARGGLFASLSVNDSSLPENLGSDTVVILSFSGALTVHVADDSGNAVGSANVTTVSGPAGQAKVSALTTIQGLVAFPCLSPGSYMVQVSGSGFSTLQSRVTVSNSTVTLNLTVIRPKAGFPYAVLYAGIGAAVAAVLVGVWLARSGRKSK